MCRFKMSRVVVFVGMMTFVLGMAATDQVVAGDKVKGRVTSYTVKWQSIDVPGAEGHMVGVFENKGIVTIFEGTYKGAKPDGAVIWTVGMMDFDSATGKGSMQGYDEVTDKEGNKRYYAWEGKPAGEGVWEGEYWAVRGTGACEGIKERGNWRSYNVAPGQGYADWQGEYEYVR